MSTIKLTGHEAIAYAEHHGGTLCKHADPTEDDRDDLTPDQAREVARVDESLIYTYAPGARWVLAGRPSSEPEFGKLIRERDEGDALVEFGDGATAWCCEWKDA